MRAPDEKLVALTRDLGEESFDITAKNKVSPGVNEAAAEVKAVMKEIDGTEAEATVILQNKKFLAEIRECDAQLKKLAAMKADPKVGVDDSEFDRQAAAILAKKEALARKIEIPVDLDRSALARGSTALRGLNKDLEHSDGLLKRWFTSLSKVRLSMGFLSGTLRQFAYGFTGLAPIIVGLVGTASSLIGVLGTGLVGALSVAGAAATGFGLVVAGLISPLKTLFKEAGKAENIGGVFKGMGEELTKAIRPDFMDSANAAVKTATSLFPMYKANATAAFGAASDGFQDWMTALRSPEAKNVLQSILGNFTKAIPGIMQGLGSLGAMMGRVFGSAAKFLPSLSGGFAKWAQQLGNAIGSGAELDTKMGRLVTHMRDVGHLGQAAGRTIVTFFNAGADSGDDMVNSLTGVMNQWTDWMKSVKGQESLSNFFERSERLARQLFPAIGRIATAMANLATAAEPVSEGIVTGLNAIAKVAAAMPPPLLQAAGAFLVLRKAMTFLMGAQGLTALTAGLGRLAPMVGALSAAFRVGGLSTALSQAGIAAGALLAPLTGAGAVFATTVIGARYLSSKMDEMSDATREANERWRHQNTLVKQLPTTYAAWRNSIQTTKQAQDAYNESLKRSGARSHETAVALRVLNSSIREQNAQLASLRARGLAAYQQGIGQSATATQNLNRYLKSTDPYVTQLATGFANASGKGQEFAAAVAKNGTSVIGLARSLQQVGLSIKDVGLSNLPMLQNALQTFNQSQQKSAAQVVNYARSLKGLGPVTGQAAQAVGKFIQQFGQVKGAKRAVISTNAPAEAAKVARLSTQLNSVGKRKAVVRILASDKDASGKIDALQRKVDGVNRKKGVAKLDAQDNASGKIAKAKGELDGFSKKYDAVMHVLGADAAAASARNATSAAEAFNGTSTHYFNSVYKSSGSPGGPMGGYRGGIFAGGFAGGADGQMMADAYEEAREKSPIKGAYGAKLAKPTFIVGEERRPEYVIATNPAYRHSNMAYLSAAAADFGMMLVPGYKKGKKGGGGGAQAAKKKKKKGGGEAPEGNANLNLDDATGPGSAYDLAQKQVTFDSTWASLVQRNVEAGTATVADWQNAIQTEITDYQGLAGIISGLIGPGYVKSVPVPKVSKVNPKAKGKAAKRQKKAQKKSQEAHDKATEHNDAARSQEADLRDELRTINELTIPGLELDKTQAASAASSLAFQNMETAGTLRQAVFNQYAGNLMSGGAQFPALGPTGLGTSTTNPALTGGGGLTSGTTIPTSGSGGTQGPSSDGGTTVNITQSFAAPPPDAHTYAQNVAFEVGAAV